MDWFGLKGTFKDHLVQLRLPSPTLTSLFICFVKCFIFNFFWSLPFNHFPTWRLLCLLFSAPCSEKRCAHGSMKTWCNHWERSLLLCHPVGNIHGEGRKWILTLSFNMLPLVCHVTLFSTADVGRIYCTAAMDLCGMDHFPVSLFC